LLAGRPGEGKIRRFAAPRRLLFYSHDGVGLGHVRRNLAIAAAVVEADPRAAVLIATSADEVAEMSLPPAVDVLKLPGLRKLADGRYESRRLRVEPAQLHAVRGAVLEAAVDSFRPSVLLADKHPLGVGGELRGALRTLRAQGARSAFGLRDILDESRRVREEWARHGTPARIAKLYDRVLVYGDPTVFDPVSEYRMPADVRAIARFCGYVTRPGEVRPRYHEQRRRPLVAATAGGGEDGFRLLRTFVAAAAGMPWDAVLVSGRQSRPREREALRAAADAAGIVFHEFVRDLAAQLPDVDALVCMGGYNTLVEAVAAGVPAVCVPRTAPRQEQLIRARRFSELGLVSLLEPAALSPELLRAEVARALELPSGQVAARATAALPLGGARVAAAELLALHERAARPQAVVATA
jgi:predicted glycosyltransferase